MTGILHLTRKLHHLRCLRLNAERALQDSPPDDMRDALRAYINDVHGIEEDLFRLDLILKRDARNAMAKEAA